MDSVADIFLDIVLGTILTFTYVYAMALIGGLLSGFFHLGYPHLK